MTADQLAIPPGRPGHIPSPLPTLSPTFDEAMMEIRELGQAHLVEARAWLDQHVDDVRADLGLPRRPRSSSELLQQVGAAYAAAAQQIARALIPAARKMMDAARALSKNRAFLEAVLENAERTGNRDAATAARSLLAKLDEEER